MHPLPATCSRAAPLNASRRAVHALGSTPGGARPASLAHFSCCCASSVYCISRKGACQRLHRLPLPAAARLLVGTSSSGSRPLLPTMRDPAPPPPQDTAAYRRVPPICISSRGHTRASAPSGEFYAPPLLSEGVMPTPPQAAAVSRREQWGMSVPLLLDGISPFLHRSRCLPPRASCSHLQRVHAHASI